MRTTQELDTLTRAQHIREITRLEYEAEHYRARAEAYVPGVNVVATEAFDAQAKALAETLAEAEVLRQQVHTLRAERSVVASAELTKLRNQLAAAKQALKAKGLE